jgi:hypothetical protein
VQIVRYLSTAQKAKREAIASQLVQPKTTTTPTVPSYGKKKA